MVEQRWHRAECHDLSDPGQLQWNAIRSGLRDTTSGKLASIIGLTRWQIARLRETKGRAWLALRWHHADDHRFNASLSSRRRRDDHGENEPRNGPEYSTAR